MWREGASGAPSTHSLSARARQGLLGLNTPPSAGIGAPAAPVSSSTLSASPASSLRSSKAPGLAIDSASFTLNVDSSELDAQTVPVRQISKVKTTYSYYLGELVASSGDVVAYVVTAENIRVLGLRDDKKLLLRGHVKQIFDLRFASVAAPSLLASVCRGGRFFVWDVNTVDALTPVVALKTEDSSQPEVHWNKLCWQGVRANGSRSGIIALADTSDTVTILNVDQLVARLAGRDTLASALKGENVTDVWKLPIGSAVHGMSFSPTRDSVIAVATFAGTLQVSCETNSLLIALHSVSRLLLFLLCSCVSCGTTSLAARPFGRWTRIAERQCIACVT